MSRLASLTGRQPVKLRKHAHKEASTSAEIIAPKVGAALAAGATSTDRKKQASYLAAHGHRSVDRCKMVTVIEMLVEG